MVEAMNCGLPTFATCHGGPMEIIEDGVSGFHVDPYHPNKAAELMVEFFQRCKQDPTYWEKISSSGLQRILERFVVVCMNRKEIKVFPCFEHYSIYLVFNQF